MAILSSPSILTEMGFKNSSFKREDSAEIFEKRLQRREFKPEIYF